ncbi:hypothetical protein NDU88_005945 [Pleurodeles waltl]|uniref:Uncharacterized protein n=1 Tax=Pleurodeles waltl TaxID=8319 RepID=A0AAV7RQJ8_PLEWA|nr:hypothetical protein NDU88_005945 [Pleurodeles waltl]
MKYHHSTHPAGPYLCPQDTSISSVSITTGTPGNPTNTGRSGSCGQWLWAHSSGDRGTGQQGSWEDCCAPAGGQGQGNDSPGGTHQHPGSIAPFPRDDGPDTGQVTGDPAAAGETVPGVREDLRDIHTTLVTIAGVLADMASTMREAVGHQWAPDTSHTDEQPSTSASGQEAPPQEQQATSIPPPAEGEPPSKRSLRSRQKPETIAETPARK